MPVVNSTLDPDALSLTFVAEFAAGVDAVWEVLVDPRKLERWWGPPMWPATFTRHEPAPGGASLYYMTGPDGTQAHGWWETVAVEPPHRYEFLDGFADDQGNRMPGDPVRGTFTLETIDGGTRLTAFSEFADLEQLKTMADMGMEEGMRLAMGQIDSLLV